MNKKEHEAMDLLRARARRRKITFLDLDINTPTVRYYIRQSLAALERGETSCPFGWDDGTSSASVMVWGAMSGWPSFRRLRGKIDAMLEKQPINGDKTAKLSHNSTMGDE